MLAECEQRGHTLSRLRLHLTKRCQETPAALLWLMAIKAEAVLPAGHIVSRCSLLCCDCVLLCCAVLPLRAELYSVPIVVGYDCAVPCCATSVLSWTMLSWTLLSQVCWVTTALWPDVLG